MRLISLFLIARHGLILSLLLTCLLYTTHAATYPGNYTVDILRIIDGDTIEVRAHIWPGLTQQIKVRLNRADTPEIRGSECEKALAQKATDYTSQILNRSDQIVLTDIAIGSFAGRVLGDLIVDGKSLNDLLINSGHARLYHRNDKREWCQ